LPRDGAPIPADRPEAVTVGRVRSRHSQSAPDGRCLGQAESAAIASAADVGGRRRALVVGKGSATTVNELKAIVRVECDRGDVLVDLVGDGLALHVVLIALGRSIAKGILY
jgi:hypothetical protein